MIQFTKDYGVELYVAPVEATAAAAGSRCRLASQADQKRVRDALVAARFGAAAQLQHDAYGAPLIAGAAGISVSLSHCSELVAMAVRRGPLAVGVDVETLSRYGQLQRLAPRFLSPDELPLWSREPSLLLTAWVLKEAFYKAAGQPGWALADIPVRQPELLTGEPRRMEVERFGRKFVLEVMHVDSFAGLLGLVTEIRR